MKYHICHWEKPKEEQHISLKKNDLHIWKINLLENKSIDSLYELLSHDERARAKRFHFKEHSRRFIVSHGMLRQILACYVNVSADTLTFSYTEKGKPELLNSHNHIRFNLSHSHEMALVGVLIEVPIGIDIEYLPKETDVDGLAKRFFSSQEYEQLSKIPNSIKQEAFFRIWTLKEAYLKATGEGIAGLESVEVMCAVESPPEFVKINGSSEESQRWSVYSLKPEEDYIASVVVKKSGHTIQYFIP
ncbi:4'-phosphopantetheinyl transferase family protein [Chlamydiota bacterium]